MKKIKKEKPSKFKEVIKLVCEPANYIVGQKIQILGNPYIYTVDEKCKDHVILVRSNAKS